jgi:predicted methyltransferase
MAFRQLAAPLAPLLVALAACRRAPPAAESSGAPLPSAPRMPEAAVGASRPSPAPLTRAEIDAVVNAPDRDAGDREADARRKPAEFLAFLGVRRGMRVADLGAGFGHTTELLARAVGPEGRVYGQNPKFVLERFAEKGWSARLAKPVNANVVRLDREFADPLPDDVGDLDLVVNVLFYHDFEWMNVDRAAHDADVFRALKPGGR